MNKVPFLLIVIFFFYACGGSSGSNTTTESFLTQQWSINYNQEFYSQNGIDQNAHIKGTNSFTNYTGRNIRVAVIDDGFDVNHPEIKDKIVATVSVNQVGNVIGTDVAHTNTNDDTFHGTAVTGIIASNMDDIGIRGIAPNVELILIKFPVNFTDSAVIELFNQAVSHGADIINCSWGTNAVSDTVRAHVNSIATTGRNGKGVLVVFASGNDNKSIQNDESSIKGVIAVGATDKSNLRTSYSDFGVELDLVAPGGNSLGITTIDPLGTLGASDDEYIRFNERKDNSNSFFIGTSAAAPIVSGVLALALEKNNNLTRTQIQKILKYSTDTIGLNTPYLDEMISSSSNPPTITGLLGTSGNSAIKVRLKFDANNTVYGPYDVTRNENNNTFFSTPSTQLPEGNYTIELIDNNQTFIYATDTHFEINSSKTNEVNSSIRKSDFYGYGKINTDKFLNNIQ